MTSLLCITIISLTLAGSAFSQPTGATLKVEVKVLADIGANITLPCQFLSNKSMSLDENGMRIKWTKVAEDEALNEDVLLSMGLHKKTYGRYEDHAFLQDDINGQASLLLTNVAVEDSGTYRCELISGVDDVTEEITLVVGHFGIADLGIANLGIGDLGIVDLGIGNNDIGATESSAIEGVVFPYSPSSGRYNMNFHEATEACLQQNASVASLAQLDQAWQNGLDWCNAGWLNDGSVHYPIKKPRGPCGGNRGPGIISYGSPDKNMSRYDVFCFAAAFEGNFYWLVQPDRLTFDEAVAACLDDGAEIATVGHMYSAWKLEGYDRCDAGWLADGSIRYPISKPRKNCSPTEAAVRFVGFPDKTQKSYGVYCYKENQ